MKKEIHSFGNIARRTAFSFFLFSVVLASLLTLSWYLLVPELTRVDVGGSVRGLSELREYKTDLEAQISSLEGQRGTFLRPVNHNLYEQIKALKSNRQKFQSLRSDLNHAMVTLVPGQKNVVYLSGLYFDAASNKAEVRGVIDKVGPRSMTVLAQFVEAIDHIPQVLKIETSRFVRYQRDDGSFYSPFTLILTVR